MRIGVPKEIKKHEYRVGLTWNCSVSKYVAEGHELFVETNAGIGTVSQTTIMLKQGQPFVQLKTRLIKQK